MSGYCLLVNTCFRSNKRVLSQLLICDFPGSHKIRMGERNTIRATLIGGSARLPLFHLSTYMTLSDAALATAYLSICDNYLQCYIMKCCMGDLETYMRYRIILFSQSARQNNLKPPNDITEPEHPEHLERAPSYLGVLFWRPATIS